MRKIVNRSTKLYIKDCNSISLKIPWDSYSDVVCEQVEVNIKYAGYLARQDQELKQINQLDRIFFPDDIELYLNIIEFENLVVYQKN